MSYVSSSLDCSFATIINESVAFCWISFFYVNDYEKMLTSFLLYKSFLLWLTTMDQQTRYVLPKEQILDTN